MATTKICQPTYDAIVVGGRCAGASTAMLLARRGLRVLVVERSRYGSDTLSTHALMRAGVMQLHRWGILPAITAGDTPPIRSTAFHYGDESIELPIKPRDGVDALYAPRRTVLDALLVDAAIDAGAEVVHGLQVVQLIRHGVRVAGVVLQDPAGRLIKVGARIVIGADGRRSTVARLVGSEVYRRAPSASAVIYGYWSGLEVTGNHWYYGSGVAAGVIPTNDGQSCVFAAMPSSQFESVIRSDLIEGYHQKLSKTSEELSSLVNQGCLNGRFRAFPGELGFVRQSWGAGWALVGDSGYFKDPLTAHGITDALRDAELLADAVAADTEVALAGYQALRDEMSLSFFNLTEHIASFQWDLPTVQRLHLLMSKEMDRETRMLAERGDVRSVPSAAVVA